MNVSEKYMGLVLAGGQSTRMGRDKSLLNYHGQPQRDYVRHLLLPYCDDVFIAVKNKSSEDPAWFMADDPSLGDIGPMAGLLTAFHRYPQHAWIIAGCDYPLIHPRTFSTLINAVTSASQAVAFTNPETHRAEPLLTVYLPSVLPVLEARYANGRFSLQELLGEVAVVNLEAEDNRWLQSIDTPEQAEKLIKSLS